MSKEIEVAISSFSQERLWFIHQLEPTDTAYNMMTALRVSGRLQVRALLSSFKEIVRRHEILRTTFALDQDENALLQLIQPVADVNVVVVDLRSAPGADKHSTVAALIQEERGHCFNPRKGPLLRIRLLLLDQKTNVLLVNMHHIISDGWSTGIFIRELGILYRSFTTDAQGAPPLNELAIQYGDYAEWQREHLNAAQIQHLLDYWKTQITGIPERLELPTDRTASPNPSSRGGDHVFKLDPGVVSQIKANTNQSDITPFMVFLTIFGVQLARYSGRDNLVIGSPIAGRGRRELEPLIGFFVNTLALRVDLSGNPGYRELVNRVRRTAIEAYAHQELPFEKLVEALAPRGNTNRASFFQVFFTVQNTPTESLHFPGLSLTPLEMGPSSTQFDLVLNVNDASPSPEAGFTYRTDLFDPQTIMRMGRHFCALLEEIAAHPDMAVFDLSFVAKDERRLLLVELNKESTVQRPSNWIHRIVEGHASKIPDHPAIRFDGGLLTFKELNRESDQWCARLRAVGVAPGKPVGLLLENCPEMAAVLLGILKAGGFYVPLDPALPNTRLSRMLKDSGALLVVTERALASVIPVADHGPIRILFIDEGREKDSPHPLSGPDRTVDGAQLAYLIFTSGSTGTPKGVAVTHQGLADYIAWGVNTHSLERGVGVPFHAPLSFDASVPVLWAPLAAGCPIWPIPQSLGIEALASLVFSEKHFSLVNLTPAHLEMLFQSRPHSSAVIHTDYLTGRIDADRDEDVFRVTATKGMKLSIQVESDSLGFLLDPLVQVLDAEGKIIGEVDDSNRKRDCVLTQAIPADGEYRIVVRDVHRKGGFRYVYRMTIGEAKPDFDLTLASDSYVLTPGKPLEIPVTIARQNGFNGEIEVTAIDLPDGVRSEVVKSEAKGDTSKAVTVVINADVGPTSAAFSISGKSVGEPAIERIADYAIVGINARYSAPWLTVVAPADGK